MPTLELLVDRLRVDFTRRGLKEVPALEHPVRFRAFVSIDVRTLLRLYSQQFGVRPRYFRIEPVSDRAANVWLSEKVG